MLIDMHAHIVPEHFPAAGKRDSADRWPFMDHFEAGRAKVMIAGENFRTVTEQCWNSARRTGDMTKEGVDVQVISPMPELFSYWFTSKDALEMSHHVNETIARMAQSSPRHFYGLGMAPLQDPDLAARQLSKIKQMGLLGVEIGSNVEGKSLGEARFLPFWQEVERLEMAVSDSMVRFCKLSPRSISEYIDSGEPMDKAGGYAIQGRAAAFIPELRGSYSGVMGLPLYETAELISRFADESPA